MRYRMPSGATLKERLAYFSEPSSCGCRLWKGALDGNGYGLLWTGKRNRRAHIVAWEEANNRPVPAGMLICHTCDIRNCIGENHLFLGTHTDNNQDRERKGRGRQPKGERNHKAKLTEKIVRAIRVDFRSSLIIAAELHINSSTVNRVRNRETWRHVA